MKKCGNCKHRWHKDSYFGNMESCLDYEFAETEEDEIKSAATCGRYEEGDPENEEEYCPSSTAGDYGPGNPWDSPGYRISDFI